MAWYQYLTLISLLFCCIVCLMHLFRLIRLGSPVDYATPGVKTGPAIAYSFTGAMSPVKKESAYLHLPTYTAGILFHLGSFLSMIILAVHLFSPIITGFLSWPVAVFLFASGTCGISILVKRIIKSSLRNLSSPDDYLSNILVTLFQLATALSLILPAAGPVYFVVSAILFFWFPVGKLRHALYFFAARYHLGLFYGRRGVWPPKPR
ncbi:MAG: hypothetical protein PHP04_02860 [Bacteroidales bacterium]|nr:hypothetical protein [Bacteroidales bacterium]HNW72525.1 hypothetical protein [Bacteroidales bacterium]